MSTPKRNIKLITHRKRNKKNNRLQVRSINENVNKLPDDKQDYCMAIMHGPQIVDIEDMPESLDPSLQFSHIPSFDSKYRKEK